MNKDIKKIRELEWREVFSFWYKAEGSREEWIRRAKERGFSSWTEWRTESYAKPFECSNAEWSLYEVCNPEIVIPRFYGGPFRTWIERQYRGQKEEQFINFENFSSLMNNEKVKSIADNYPEESVIIALESNKKIFVVEGFHRSCALTFMFKQNIKAPKKIFIAIGKSNLDELPIVGQNMKKYDSL